jgi:hypothetical protein
MSIRAERGVAVKPSGLIAAMAACLAAAALLLGGFADRADAKAPITSFKTVPTSVQAGGHGDLLVSVGFRPDLSPEVPCHCNVPKDITVNLPPGIFGIPQQVPRCTNAEFSLGECPVESQVGVAYLVGTTLAIFNMVPRSDQAALLATETPLIGARPIYTSFTVRTDSDFGLESKSFGIPRVISIETINFLFWGVPGDPSHDALRFPPGGWGEAVPDFAQKDRGQFGCFGRDTTSQLLEGINPLREPDGICADIGTNGVQPAVTPYNGTVQPFLNFPTRCSGPQQSNLDVTAYDLENDHATAPFPAISGCDVLSFDPSLTAKPTTTEADSPSGLDVELTVPEPTSPYSPTPSQIHDTTITLPQGFTINSNAADGKSSCSDAEARFGTREQAECPEDSKIGSLQIHSSALPGVLPGAIYLGNPLPGNRYRVFLTANGFSLHIKIAGFATLDPVTGQVTIRFDELPQAPFQRFTLHIFGGERGLLSTPAQCGEYPVKTEFAPWDNDLPNQTSTQYFTIDSGPNGSPCPPPERSFNPHVSAGVSDNTGGAHTTFAFDLTREDGDQNLAGVDVITPPGFSGTLAGIPYCPDATLAALAQSSYLGGTQLATPTCSASRIGEATAKAGSGSRPVTLAGSVYLAGPYKGAPVSLAIVTPAVSGPYDLGNVVVRVALQVDPTDAHITAISDPLPQILEGIPLHLREILILLNRSGFALNPTNCAPLSIGTTVVGDQGATSNLTSGFQVANCGTLDFSPQLQLKLTGGINRRGHPAIHALLRAKPGEANIRSVSVALPKGEQLDNSHLGTVCTKVNFAKDACPSGSLLGTAEVTTPLLDQPLKGFAYLRSSQQGLPDLALKLKGQVDIEAIGTIDSVNEGLRTTFKTVPDVPFSSIALNLAGGKKGLLQNTESLCGARKKATVKMTGQNGAKVGAKVGLQVNCAAKRRHRRHHLDASPTRKAD